MSLLTDTIEHNALSARPHLTDWIMLLLCANSLLLVVVITDVLIVV